MHDFLNFPTGCAKARRSPLASLPGVGYDVLAHSTDPPLDVSIFFAREGGEHAAQFGVARFAGGSSWKFQELLPMRVDILVFEWPGLECGPGSPFGAPEPPHSE